jgi:hypothetical protein
MRQARGMPFLKPMIIFQLRLAGPPLKNDGSQNNDEKRLVALQSLFQVLEVIDMYRIG